MQADSHSTQPRQQQDKERLIGRVRSAIVGGVRATLVTVEVHRGNGLPRQTIVGLPDGAVRESLERIHAACSHHGLGMKPRRTTINLAPAGFRKSGAALDLPIALSLMIADGALPPDRLDGTVCLGELGLDGRVRPIPGVLPGCLAAREAGARRVLVPPDNRAEAVAVPGLEVLSAPDLATAVAWARGEAELEPASRAGQQSAGCAHGADATLPPPGAVDLAQVRGQALARRALEIAAAGGHHLLLSGPPGSGKTLLARCLPGLLPPLTETQSLQTSSIYSVIGGLVGRGLIRTPPFRAPHHSVTPAGMIGGGMPLRPGEISLATHGVLFLDEIPEFQRAVLESLRQPLEEGTVSIVRANEAHTFPARFCLIGAMNECPCGRGADHPDCACGELEVARYWKRISGPLVDRIDLFVGVDRVPLEQITQGPPAESSSAVRERVIAARDRQRARNGDRAGPSPVNAALTAPEVNRHCNLRGKALDHARDAADRLGLSARAWYRALRVALTISDLAGTRRVHEAHVMEALRYREPAVGA